ncbi:alcohol-forming fatty acyl-CoA reductase-like [Gossypium australe]|uniref:Fatty acyl-CoA reductase n=1 Tax=Gossypium australe TaxID=47621 RepID=A0A5B6UE86_9ROSI|nr:alcohol-forming fatty acyl-CoA reductase-like [Gossypium australe]
MTDNMELDNITKFLQGKTILVTGATGFLAKVFIEKILRLQLNVNKLYLLLRTSNDKSATQRLEDEIISTELFRILRDKWGSKFDALISSKVIAVEGDISSENLGLKDSKLREEIRKEIEIVVNSAATTWFNERYDVALGINTFGAFNVLNFGKKCDKIKLFLHISTAYVCGEKADMILEKRFYMGETLKGTHSINIFEEKRIMEEQLAQLQYHGAPDKAINSSMKEFGLERAKLNGWPNTYVFTKAMGEMLLGQFKADLPLVIIRPTMIASTYKQPFPGWIEGVRTFDIFIVSYGKGELTCFPANPNTILDVIPVDMVVNAMVVAMKVHYAERQHACEIIYHVSSSFRNPLTVLDLRNLFQCYFIKNPWIDANGMRVKVGQLTVFSKANRFLLLMQMKYVLPLKVLYLANILCCQRFKKIYKNLNRKINFIIQLAKLFEPYTFFLGSFNDENLVELQRVAQEQGIDLVEFNFDSKSIEWEEYMTNIHIPGLLKYGIKS